MKIVIFTVFIIFNKKRQINCYDTDGTRVEIMEAKTVDGMTVPSSTAPPLKYLPTAN